MACAAVWSVAAVGAGALGICRVVRPSSVDAMELVCQKRSRGAHCKTCERENDENPFLSMTDDSGSMLSKTPVDSMPSCLACACSFHIVAVGVPAERH